MGHRITTRAASLQILAILPEPWGGHRIGRVEFNASKNSVIDLEIGDRDISNKKSIIPTISNKIIISVEIMRI